MSDNYSMKDIAKQLNVSPDTVRRLIEKDGHRLGISLQAGRANSSNAKWSHFLTRDDANKLIAHYESKRTAVIQPQEGDSNALQQYGMFYIIQLIPEALPNRIKIGYTDNLDKRLLEHQTAAPTARVICSWPCKRSWDYAVMDSITRENCTWVMNEVFEGEPEGFIQRANAFFSLMPTPDAERSLSEHSPLRIEPHNKINTADRSRSG